MGWDWRILAHALTTKASSSTVTVVMKNMLKNARHMDVSACASDTASTEPTICPRA